MILQQPSASLPPPAPPPPRKAILYSELDCTILYAEVFPDTPLEEHYHVVVKLPRVYSIPYSHLPFAYNSTSCRCRPGFELLYPSPSPRMIYDSDHIFPISKSNVDHLKKFIKLEKSHTCHNCTTSKHTRSQAASGKHQFPSMATLKIPNLKKFCQVWKSCQQSSRIFLLKNISM